MAAPNPSDRTAPPQAERRPHRLEAHGRVRVDDWYWLADRDDPAVLTYLRAENDYADAVLAPTLPLQGLLFEEIRSRVAETDAGPPSRRGDWWYWSRTTEGLQYRTWCRRPDPGRALTATTVAADARSGRAPAETGEEVVLDENGLAGDGGYLALGVFDISPDDRILAYAADLDGSERFTLRFRDLPAGTDRPDVVDGVYYGSAWSPDGSTIFYVRPDDAMRPYQVWRHTLGSDPAGDDLVFQEDDERFFVDVDLTRNRQAIVIRSDSKTSSEVRWIAASTPGAEPRVVLARAAGVEYDLEHDGDGWLVRTNCPGPDGSAATNFALCRLPLTSSDPADLVVVIPHRSDVRLDSVEAFAGHLVVTERASADGLERLRLLDRAGVAAGDGTTIDQPEPAYSLLGEANAEWAATTYRFGYTSLVTPRSSVEYDVATGRRTTVWTERVGGDYDPADYRTERLWAPSPDGTAVPVSVVARRDVRLEGSAPCVLYGYGAYEIPMDPSFSAARLNLLRRGVCFAIAHIRGGGELGRSWYEDGKMDRKVNTFVDFVAAADHLIREGWADPARLAARGGSAGGLLMGAVVNRRPDLWRAVVAEVPFVDVVTTMSDTSLPLTVTEWEEWGDPLHDPDAYERMLSYSPYDNVEPAAYPALLVTAGLNDPRVGYWEPAKWVAKLRSVGAGFGDRPVLLRTELGAGHQGPSGRYDAWRDEARVQAFLLTQLDATVADDPDGRG